MKYIGRPKQLVRRSALALAGAAVFTIPALGLVAVGPAQALADEALPQPAALEAPAVAGAAQSQEQDQAQGETQAREQAGGNAQAAAAAGPQGESGARGATQAQAQTEARGQGRPQAGAQAREQPQAPAAEAPGWHSGAGGTYYVDPDGSRHTGWLVTDTYEDYGLQRYWLGADGVLRGSSLVDAADAGWWAYSRPEGYVVRGRWVDSSSGLVYLADNDGRLESPGWHVTDSYGGGLQRYWVDASAHAAVPGYSADGWAHYTLADGSALRGAAEEGGEKWLADNDGRLASGWAVTSAFGGGLQRYWFGSDGRLVRGGLVSPERAGWWAYATPGGYVVRGKWADPETGLVYLADNDGRLADPGWHVTSAYGGGLQRYWVDASAHAAVPGYSQEGWAHYTLADGSVLRGALSSASGKWLADNDGRLASGWVVTDALGDGLQRYWFGSDGRLVRGGLVSPERAGWWAYATPGGYVVRGKWADPETGLVYLADNDGRLADPGWHVTSAYGGGLQRYWVDASAHAAVPGYSQEGWAHYTLADGSVLRGALVKDGERWLADNNGLLASGWTDSDAFEDSTETYYFVDGKAKQSCWIVSADYKDYGLQRYWLKSNGALARGELVDAADAGWWAYARPDGYVVRGKWTDPSTGYVYLANNDGKLEDPGWVVTGEYDGDLQRYWIDAKTHSAIPGYSSAGWPHVTLREGYVLRGETTFNGVKYSADNDGRVTGAAKDDGVTYTRYSFTLLAMAEKEHAQDRSHSVEEYAALLDPGKYSQGDNEFYQFAVLNGASHYCSAAQLNAFIAHYHSEGNLAGYGQTFIDAAAANGINAEYLLAHAILESGWGTSQLASGYAYDGKTAINGKTYAAGTYYNFFGIGAYDSSPLSGGRSMAVQNGWNSVSAAISGAASWLSRWYINSATYKQDTLYKMRWDVNDVEQGDTPWHQYATGTGWATDIADVMAMIYKYTGVTPGYTYDLPSYR